MSTKKLYVSLIAVLVMSFAVMTSSAQAEIKPGIRATSYFDPTKGGIGAELLTNLNDEHTFYFNPNFEYVFLERSDLWTFNFDFHYDLLTAEPVYFWVGGGPAIHHRDPDLEPLGSDTDFGVNVLAGVGFRIRGTNLVPYVQPKYTFIDNDRFSIAFGLRF